MGKGVISEIRPDDMMPVDDNGIRADIIMTPASIVNRMNPSQLFEQFWNRVADQVVKNARDNKMGWRQAYRYFLGFCKDFRANYAKALDEYLLDTDEKKKAWTEEILETGIIRLLAAWTKKKPYGFYVNIAKKYGVEVTPVTYKVRDEDTGELRTIRTKNPAMIGSKYLLYLGKIPDDTITAVEFGHVNQFELPIKQKSKRVKEQSLIGLTPQKFGEDEVCMLNMSLGGPTVARMMCLHSCAPTVSKELFTQLLKDPHPTQLVALDMPTSQIIKQNRNIRIFADMMGAIGYDVRSEKDIKKAGGRG